MYIPRFCGSSAHSVISYAIKQTSQNGDRLQSETGEIAISDMLEFSRNVRESHSAGGICITMRAVADPEISPPGCLPIRSLCGFRPQNLGMYTSTRSVT
jgi:hypothetical protein